MASTQQRQRIQHILCEWRAVWFFFARSLPFHLSCVFKCEKQKPYSPAETHTVVLHTQLWRGNAMWSATKKMYENGSRWSTFEVERNRECVVTVVLGICVRTQCIGSCMYANERCISDTCWNYASVSGAASCKWEWRGCETLCDRRQIEIKIGLNELLFCDLNVLVKFKMTMVKNADGFCMGFSSFFARMAAAPATVRFGTWAGTRHTDSVKQIS